MGKDGASLVLKDEEGNVMSDFSKMLGRAAKIRGFLNRVVYPRYQQEQTTRWVSQGVSQTGPWKELNDKYLRWRKRIFPDSGDKILVRTGDLARSMTGADTTHHFKLVSNKRLEVGTVLDYGQYVDEERDITGFTEETMNSIIDDMEKYLVGV